MKQDSHLSPVTCFPSKENQEEKKQERGQESEVSASPKLHVDLRVSCAYSAQLAEKCRDRPGQLTGV